MIYFLEDDIAQSVPCLMSPKGDVFMTLQRITVNSGVCGGKPTIRGLRFPVSRLLGLLAAGEPQDSILESYPNLEPEDIQEALSYVAFWADEQVVEWPS